MPANQFSLRAPAARGWRCALLALAAGAAPALAGGGPENVLIVVNPASSEAMYIADYYRNARGIPERNVVYLDPGPASYPDFTAANGALDGLLGQLKNARIDDHIDYIVVSNGGSFYVSAPGYVTDGCSPVTKFAQSAVYTMAYLKPYILAGGLPSTTTNQYYSSGGAVAFSSNTAWLFGNPSTSGAARRYFIGAQLGYTGGLGNSVAEVLTMIDRSVGADGTRPAGTFYFMSTTDPDRNVRAPQFTAAISGIVGAGGSAQQVSGVLPDGMPNCLGVMTGWADPNIDGSSMVLLPGAFGDHLTSWAAAFDIGAQTKMSSWIRHGASGSSGTVEEPCNYTGKFVSANFHNLYFRGMSLGEAWLRSMSYVPFQSLLVADPLCRPFAQFPTVQGNAPSGVVSGTVQFTPAASTPIAGASILQLDLYVDGVFHSRRQPGQAFTLNTIALDDGYHELRVVAYDNTPVKTTGRWTGSILTSMGTGHGVSATLGTSAGDMTTRFQLNSVSATGGPVELRLLHNGRVIAAGGAGPGLDVYGRNIGCGPSRLQVEAVYADGTVARSAPMPVNVAYTGGAGSGQAPVAFSYRKRVVPGASAVVELPARFDDPLSGATWTLLSGPSQATVGSGSAGYRVITVPAGACGPDQMTFRVQTPSGQSNIGTVNLFYAPAYACRADVDGDGQLTVADFTTYLQMFASGQMRADMDDSCSLNVADFTAYLQAHARGCP